MELRTQSPLTAEQIRGELACIVAILTEKQLANLDVTYGWNCEDADSQYEPVRIATEDLTQYIQRGEEAGFFRFGDCDLYIASEHETATAEFCLCHEADIHFKSTEADFVDTVKGHWLAKGWIVYQGTGESGSQWTKFP